jgi:hypothetical protein
MWMTTSRSFQTGSYHPGIAPRHCTEVVSMGLIDDTIALAHFRLVPDVRIHPGW